jgi:hypothetical protein
MTSAEVRPLIAASLLLLGLHTARVGSQEAALPFSCVTFGAQLTEADLVARFGRSNVTSGPVPWGGAEGDYTDGTIVFADRAKARLEIYWKNREAKRDPGWIDIRGAESLWRSPAGITLGMDLKTVEAFNRRPFRIAGFGSNGSGFVPSWSGGLLAREDIGGCRLQFRFVPPDVDTRPDLQVFMRQVDTGRIYSSGHPAMQALNPRIGEGVITYGPS